MKAANKKGSDQIAQMRQADQHLSCSHRPNTCFLVTWLIFQDREL